MLSRNIKGYNKEVGVRGELEHCSTSVFPNYNYEQKLDIVGVYRPPITKHPPYEEVLKQILQSNSQHKVTTILAGDFNINTWKTEYLS